MNIILKHARLGVIAATLAAFSAPLLAPSPAAAWWRHPGWGYRGYGCCYYGGPRVVVGYGPRFGYGPPVVVGYGPPVVVGPVWVRAHWNGPYFVPGHWR